MPPQEVALRAAYRLHVEMGWRDTSNVSSHRAYHLWDLHAILPAGGRPPPVFKVNRLTRNLEPQDSILAVYTDGSKGMKLDADLSTAAHKAKRAQRFAEGGSRDRRDQPRSKPLNIMASINNQLLQGRFSGS